MKLLRKFIYSVSIQLEKNFRLVIEFDGAYRVCLCVIELCEICVTNLQSDIVWLLLPEQIK